MRVVVLALLCAVVGFGQKPALTEIELRADPAEARVRPLGGNRYSHHSTWIAVKSLILKDHASYVCSANGAAVCSIMLIL